MSELVKITGDKQFPIEYYSMGKTKILSLELAKQLRDGLTECINALSGTNETMDYDERASFLSELSLNIANKIIDTDLAADGDLNSSMDKIHHRSVAKFMNELTNLSDAKMLLAHCLTTHLLQTIFGE